MRSISGSTRDQFADAGAVHPDQRRLAGAAIARSPRRSAMRAAMFLAAPQAAREHQRRNGRAAADSSR